MGKPTVCGTRITVELFLEKRAAGETFEHTASRRQRQMYIIDRSHRMFRRHCKLTKKRVHDAASLHYIQSKGSDGQAYGVRHADYC